MENLTERQEVLYHYLIHRANINNNYNSKENICNVLNEWYPRHLEKSNEHNSLVFANLRKDVRAINFSQVEKIIVSSPKGYKIATKDEAECYIKRKLKSSLIALKLYWKIKGKIALDKQLDINLHEIETFVGE